MKLMMRAKIELNLDLEVDLDLDLNLDLDLDRQSTTLRPVAYTSCRLRPARLGRQIARLARQNGASWMPMWSSGLPSWLT